MHVNLINIFPLYGSEFGLHLYHHHHTSPPSATLAPHPHPDPHPPLPPPLCFSSRIHHLLYELTCWGREGEGGVSQVWLGYEATVLGMGEGVLELLGDVLGL